MENSQRAKVSSSCATCDFTTGFSGMIDHSMELPGISTSAGDVGMVEQPTKSASTTTNSTDNCVATTIGNSKPAITTTS